MALFVRERISIAVPLYIWSTEKVNVRIRTTTRQCHGSFVYRTAAS